VPPTVVIFEEEEEEELRAKIQNLGAASGLPEVACSTSVHALE
jgi:hypothetical protein